MIAEFPQVVHAPPGPDRLTRRQRHQRRAAGLLRLPGPQVRIGEHHHGEEVAAGKRPVPGRPDTAAGALRGIRHPAKVPQAVPEFRGQFRLIEILDPVRVSFGVAPLELPDGLSHRTITRLSVAQPGQRACLHGVKVSRQRGGGDPARPGPGCPRKVRRLPEPPGIGGLMAHGIQDARAQQPVTGGVGQSQRLDEIPLRIRTVRPGVIGHPRGEQGGLSDRGEQGAADRLGIPAAQQPFAVHAEVLDQRLACVPAAEPVIKLGEQLHRGVEPLDITHPHPDAAQRVRAVARAAGRIDQPAKRGIIPRRGINQPSLEHALVGQVSPPQHGDVAGGLRWRAGILQPGIEVGCLPGMRQADPRTPGWLGSKPQRPSRRWRHAQPVGEGLEGSGGLRRALAPRILTQPSLQDAGQLRDLPLRQAMSVENRDNRAKIALRAGIQNVLPCADPLHDPAYIRRSQNHGALPVRSAPADR